MSDPKLLPCPFCGGTPFTQEHPPHKHFLVINGEPFPDHPGSFTIECNCGCGLIDDTLEEVVTRWNTRALPPASESLQEENEQLRQRIAELKGR
jgi:hypothetical protein